MEFLRFGSSIPGAYWGCCAMDIIQNMKVDPDEKQAIGLINGDSGHPITKDSLQLYLGTTYRDIFKGRMLIDSMSSQKHPDHAFLCTMTNSQINSGVGAKWLKVLAEEGFEFIAMVDNSVYSGSKVITDVDYDSVSSHENYLFGCFRNIGTGAVSNPRTPPQAWTKLKTVDAPSMTLERSIEVNKAQREWHLKRWEELSKGFKLYTLKELYDLGLTDHDIREAGTQMRGELPKHPRFQESRYQRLLHMPAAVKARDPFAAPLAEASMPDADEYDSCDDEPEDEADYG